eukprot:12040936-Alexandrium_andersonii.AAC.1
MPNGRSYHDALRSGMTLTVAQLKRLHHDLRYSTSHSQVGMCFVECPAQIRNDAKKIIAGKAWHAKLDALNSGAVAWGKRASHIAMKGGLTSKEQNLDFRAIF